MDSRFMSLSKESVSAMLKHPLDRVYEATRENDGHRLGHDGDSPGSPG